MEEYKINMEQLKARLFDDIMKASLENKISSLIVERAVATVLNVQKYGFDLSKSPFFEDGENNG